MDYSNDLIIGIDLGTATTEAAVFRDGKVDMILNFNEKIVTPSVVGLDESGNFVIGEKAKAQYIMAPDPVSYTHLTLPTNSRV